MSVSESNLSAGPGMTSLAPVRRRLTLRGGGAMRARAATTPGRLLALGAALLVGAVAFGLAAALAEHARARAAQAVRAETEPLLLESVRLYTSLSDASATVSATFLQGGREPPARRARYLGDVRASSDALASLSGRLGTSAEVRAALAQMTEEIPVYTGLVEAARANNRQGFPVGAAYLRAAATLLTGTILPGANRVYAAEARSLKGDYGRGTAPGALIVLAAASGLALLLLLFAQGWVARMSRRVVNVPMAVGTVVLIAVSVWSLAGVLSEGSRLGAARRASDAVEVLSASRVLVSRAQGDTALTLVNRGSDETDAADSRVVMGALAPPQGLLAQFPSTGVPRAAIARLDRDFVDLRAGSDRLAALVAAGQIPTAIAAAPATVARSDRLAGDLGRETTGAQGRFAAAAAGAASDLGGLAVAIPLLTVAAAAFALAGVRERLEEYR